MIYLFHGDDFKNKRFSYEKFIKSLKSFNTSNFFITRNNFNKIEIESLYSGANLFSSLSNVVFENIFEYEENRDFILEKLFLINKSNNNFIFLESKLNKNILNSFEKVNAKINTFLLSKEKKEKFDNFLLANAFHNHDKLNLWIYFRQAIDKGVGMEELIGVLFWKIKDLILKNNFTKFSEKELKHLSMKLSYLLPEARKSGRDAEISFEKFLLEVF